MKQIRNISGLAASLLALSACAPVNQQPWNGQTYAGGGQQPYGYGNQQPGYGNQQQPYGYGSQAPAPASSALGTAAELALIGILTGQLGISPQQAMGGVGSIFSVAQQRMSPGDFSQLSNSVPGMDRYLSAVPQQVASSNSSSLLGLIGGQNNTLGNLASVAGSFQALGMNTTMIGQFVPVMLQYVQGQGGAGTMNLLQRALYN